MGTITHKTTNLQIDINCYAELNAKMYAILFDFNLSFFLK